MTVSNKGYVNVCDCCVSKRENEVSVIQFERARRWGFWDDGHGLKGGFAHLGGLTYELL